MGCDIHLYAEKRNSENNSWESIPTHNLMKCWVCSGDSKGMCNNCRGNGDYAGLQLHINRNYRLFSILANVRNETGLVCIAGAKGFPEDANDMLNYEHDMWSNGDGHSFSYLTAQELLNFDWSQVSESYGFVNSKEYTNWRERGKNREPDDYLEWVPHTTSKIIKVSNDKMEEMITSRVNTDNTVTRVCWTISYKEMCKQFLSVVNTACQNTDPNNVRFVFWFDN